MHVILPSRIYRRFLINRRLSYSLSVPSARQILWKGAFRLHGFRPGHGFIIVKPIKSAALQGQKLSQSALKSSERTSGNIKFSRGRSPEPRLREGECPLSCSPPTRAFGTRKTSLIFYGRTTFQKPTTALARNIGYENSEVCLRQLKPIHL